MPDYCSRQTLKLMSISLACCFSCSQGSALGQGEGFGDSTQLWYQPAGAFAACSVLDQTLCVSPLKGTTSTTLPLLTRLSLHHFLSTMPWKVLAHLQDLGILNVPVMCRQLTPQE